MMITIIMIIMIVVVVVVVVVVGVVVVVVVAVVGLRRDDLPALGLRTHACAPEAETEFPEMPQRLGAPYSHVGFVLDDAELTDSY